MIFIIKDLCVLDVDSSAMVVDRDGLASSGSQALDVSLEQNLREGDDHTEYEPDVNHLDVSRLGQVVEHSDVPRGNNRMRHITLAVDCFTLS